MNAPRLLAYFYFRHFPSELVLVKEPHLLQTDFVVVGSLEERATVMDTHGRITIRRGTLLKEVYQRYPNLTIKLFDQDEARLATAKLHQLFLRYTPEIELSTSANGYIDLTGTLKLWGDSFKTATRILERIREEISLTASVGLGSNKLIAYLSAILSPHYSVLHIFNEKQFLEHLSPRLLPGISKSIKNKITFDFKFSLIRDLLDWELPELIANFGLEAKTLFRLIRNISPSRLVCSKLKKQVEASAEMRKHSEDSAKQKLFVLTAELTRQLRVHKKIAKRFKLEVLYTDGARKSFSGIFKSGSSSELVLYNELEKDFQTLLTRRVMLKKIHLIFEDFQTLSEQLDFLSPPNKLPQLAVALDKLYARFGDHSIRNARELVRL
jgi:DNA polymerase-4